MKRLTVLGLILSVFSSAGCLFGSTSSPTNYTIVSAVTEVFQGTLDAQGSSVFTFVIGNPDPLRITLASLTDASTGLSVTTNVKLGYGVPDGTSCSTTFSTTTSAALVSQYFQVATPGTYCVIVSDPGTLTKSLNFAVRIIHS
jgi:hypothetical protein